MIAIKTTTAGDSTEDASDIIEDLEQDTTLDSLS